MDKLERRRLLEIGKDPDPRMDYVITLAGRVPPGDLASAATVEVRYVPDRLIVDSRAFGSYVEALAQGGWESLEEIAVAVLDDINNEIVARWVQVVVTEEEDAAPGVSAHSVMIEDRQPRWDNPALLGRLKRH